MIPHEPRRRAIAVGSQRIRFRRWRRYRDTVRELKNLSPRELNDLGIFPADISRLAREASRL